MRLSTPLTDCIFISDANIKFQGLFLFPAGTGDGEGDRVFHSLPNKSDSSKIHTSYKTRNPSFTRGRGLSIPIPSPPSSPGALC